MATAQKACRRKKELEREMKTCAATKKDISRVYSLGKKIHELDFSKKYHFHEKVELQEAIKDKNSVFLIAEEKNEIVGFLLAKIIFYRAGGWCMLDNIAVEKSHRGSGISDMLLQALKRILTKQKIHYIQILEEAHHKNTRKFWKHQGFKETKKFIWAEKWI